MLNFKPQIIDLQVKLKLHFFIFSIILLTFCSNYGQNVSLYNQFNGRYDFTFIGNTLNVAENGAFDPCLILTSSAANYTMNSGDIIESAYLYWAGSGTGDFNVNLNGNAIVAERNFALTLGCKIDGTQPTPEMLDFPSVEDGLRGMAFIDNVVLSAQSDKKWTPNVL